MRSPARRAHRYVAVAFLAAGSAALLAGCRDDPAGPDGGAEAGAARANPDWTEASHGRAAPDYGLVFPQNSVNTIEISMTAAQWSKIRADMIAITGRDFGGGSGGGPGGSTSAEPGYVDVTLRFNGKKWTHVGFRLKGNSSLSSAWRQGVYKLPFRLNLDRFEDSIPAVENQRFHGFKELSLSPGWQDASLIREKVAADIFRLAGIPAARTAFYRVSIDFGQGLKYCGVYTVVEVVDDTMVQDQFGEGDGNVYKPTSRLQTFVEAQFEKKNNLTAADWSDVRAFITALSSPLRASDPARWRTGLEATFDVDQFLRWLAVSNAIVNWDSYGTMPHNYYLYHHPTRKLTWIPWDHNESLTGSPGLTGAAAGTQPGPARGLSLSMDEVGAIWPLIRYLADDPVYFARYKAHMKTFVETVFTEEDITPMLVRYHELIAPHAAAEQPGYTLLPTPAAFTNALPALQAHVRGRAALVATFLR